MKPKVLLMSAAHPATDPRLVYKIGPSLAHYYDVHAAIPNAGNAQSDAIIFLNAPLYTRLFWRILLCHPVLLWHYFRVRPALLHIFMPELIPIAIIASWLGTSVIYEVQENLFQKFEIKRYNNAWIFRCLFFCFDQLARRKFYLIFTDDAYLTEYNRLRKPHAVVRNYVLPDLYTSVKNPEAGSIPEFLYLGTISMERALDVMISAFATLKKVCPQFRVHFFGTLRVDRQTLESLPGFPEVCDQLCFHGYMDHRLLRQKIRKSAAALALLKPVADYPHSYTTKLFEYMAMGIPVITSDFPLYKNVVEHSECGFCISPHSPGLLVEKLLWIIENKDIAEKMGRNGQKSVSEGYSWKSEEKTLLRFYTEICTAK